MIKKTFHITSETGIHARPAALLAKEAMKFDSNISIEYKGISSNLKSIVGVISLGIGINSEITVSAEGKDEATAMIEIEKIMKSEGISL